MAGIKGTVMTGDDYNELNSEARNLAASQLQFNKGHHVHVTVQL